MRSDFRMAHVGVLMGGGSREREVSLNTGQACAEALQRGGYNVTAIDWSPAQPLSVVDASVDVAFLALHGSYGEGGSVQGLLNCLGIPYTGSGVLASALAMDKVRSKRLFQAAALQTPDYAVLSAAQAQQIASRGGESPLQLPCVVKPSREGSSVGVTVVATPAAFRPAVEAAQRGDDDVLVEAFIDGVELSVGIFDGDLLGAVEIVPVDELYDYSAKYESDATRYRLPALLSEAVRDSVERLAGQAYGLLDCRGVGRVDLMLDATDEAYLLEVNTLPGMTETSLVPKLAAVRGESFESLVSRMLEAARVDRN